MNGVAFYQVVKWFRTTWTRIIRIRFSRLKLDKLCFFFIIHSVFRTKNEMVQFVAIQKISSVFQFIVCNYCNARNFISRFKSSLTNSLNRTHNPSNSMQVEYSVRVMNFQREIQQYFTSFGCDLGAVHVCILFYQLLCHFKFFTSQLNGNN